SVDVDAVMRLQIICQGRGAKSAVAFADEKFRRIPAIVAAEVGVDELREHFYVLIKAPKIFVLGFADGATETGADRIDENEVGFVEQGICIVFKFVRSRRGLRG